MVAALAAGVISTVACGSGNSLTGPTNVSSDPPSVAGNYTLTLTASAACKGTLSADQSIRQYDAVVSQSGNNVGVNMTASSIFNQGTAGFFYGNTLTLEWDLADNNGGLIIVGGGNATTVSGSVISGTFTGPWGTLDNTCSAADHTFRFVRK
jgi:hypothetical protein